MEARYVHDPAPDALLDPQSAVWRGGRPQRVALQGTPLDMQPTAAIRASWAGRRIGSVPRVAVDAAHDRRRLAFRLEWEDGTEDRGAGENTAFPDGAAVLLPSVPHAPVFTMGVPGMAVNAWYWRADDEGYARHVVAEGIGTTRTVDLELVAARAEWKEGRWRLVVARALRVDTAEPVAQLQPGETTGFAVAVWDGEARERAGIKSYSGHWRELHLAGVPRARR